MSQEFPKLSIIICTYNRNELLRETLLSLINVSNIEESEVIVVDNNSTDETNIVVKECIYKLDKKVKVEYVLEEEQGLSVARNTGIERSRGRIVAFLDDDAIPNEEWIDSILEGFNLSSDIIAVGGPVFPRYEIEKPVWLDDSISPLYSIMDLGNFKKEFPKGCLPIGANMAFRKEIFIDLRFPTNLGRKGSSLISGEESWLFNNIKKIPKSKVYYLPQMKVHHHIPKERLNKKWILSRYYNEGLSIAYSCNRNLTKLKVLSISFLKWLYILIYSKKLSSDENSKLLMNCRINKIKGIIKGIIFGS